MISISIHKDKRQGWQMRVMDSGESHQREILRGGAKTPREAALWLLRNVNKLAAEVEEQLVELGFLTEAECEVVLAEADAPPVTEVPPCSSPPQGVTRET